MTKTFPEVISGIRTAKKGVEVREDIAQMGEYVEQFASTATTKAKEAEKSAERAKNAVAGIDQQKADAVKAVQQAQATATTAVTETKDAALQEVSDATADANSAANAAVQAATAAAGSASTASGAATAATTKAGESAASAEASASSASAAATSEANAKKYADEAGVKANTDKTLSVENAPADAKATGDALADKADKSIVQDDEGNVIFYSKAEVEAKIKEILAVQREEDLARIRYWVSDDPTSPASFIGGTWEQIKDCFIMAAGDTYPAGSTGGNAIHTHELDKLVATIYPGGLYFDYKYVDSDLWESNYTNSIPNGEAPLKQKNYSNGIEVIGRPTKTSSNMPPYTAKYVWQRIE